MKNSYAPPRNSAENIVFIGPAAVGKSGLAVGLMLKALENGYRGRFICAQDLFDEMYASLSPTAPPAYWSNAWLACTF